MDFYEEIFFTGSFSFQLQQSLPFNNIYQQKSSDDLYAEMLTYSITKADDISIAFFLININIIHLLSEK